LLLKFIKASPEGGFMRLPDSQSPSRRLNKIQLDTSPESALIVSVVVGWNVDGGLTNDIDTHTQFRFKKAVTKVAICW
jgi:hypothetical protein